MIGSIGLAAALQHGGHLDGLGPYVILALQLGIAYIAISLAAAAIKRRKDN